MDPLSLTLGTALLGGTAATAVSRLRARQAMVSPLRVGITGLSGAGKTVFLTSVINHLLEGAADHLPLFKKMGWRFSANRGKPNGGKEFAYDDYIQRLRSEPPQWPEPTTGQSEFRIELQMNCGGRVRKRTIDLVDYPGEWLLDLAMLDDRCQALGYDRWATEAWQDSALGPHRELSKAWQDQVSRMAGQVGPDSESAKQLLIAYAEYVKKAYHEEGLRLIQPSALFTDATASIESFCPLPGKVREEQPELRGEFARRYDAYVRDKVVPFGKRLRDCQCHVVLVDILDILKGGVTRHNESRRVLRDVLDAFKFARKRSWLPFSSGIERVAFVATKADTVTLHDRGHLRDLLEELIRATRQQLDTVRPAEWQKTFWCAAHRATEDSVREGESGPIATLKGQLHPDEQKTWRGGPWPPSSIYPGQVPAAWLEDWSRPENPCFRRFLPRRFPRRDGAVIEHLNLDTVLAFILE